ncbi:oxidoreductase [Aureimonas phyllosphaerae]|uniref:NAD(P)-dependent dehydrogenase (Short-subunit alcohol dehydrogenase family) n=1 Tax=Aureimonas phyllosphaerae TaxID=1166078 RepID=A0A7W6BN30_9HYPH|nr:oxidoreductase [Aureimonas phyllosphaerae]MBB3934926.1 NAD(P)-dependent dehydrogenase (short-subunit alcohol dehydrogenase family) [Aureimonas phyllosphaerae]MBB3958934.1 NAD(P)-dependent dehydrogenase (short-subunit alcohol dehydrogenase family) [Aureimonas phyllosphaerae]SFF40581.1 NADP-dependent 3-hydroxy acid dehydrogenase YdfG [Aureimonas phyllosphaerae]
MSSIESPVWFITGCSTGFGHELAKLVIARGWRLVATARDKARLQSLTDLAEDRVLALSLDVTDRVAIDAAVKATEERFGRIDVLVNNAGYGYQASIEEGDDAEIREQFDANVFGLFAMTRAVLPIMRRQRSGRILNLTSQAGFIGFPGSGYYAATKHAVEGFSDALAAEGAPIGIQVTCVAPGPFRTDWAGRSLRQTPNEIAEYADTAGARLKSTSEISGKQAGDPVRAGEAMIRITEMDKAPRHLVLGKIAYDGVTAKLKQRLAEIEGLKDLSLSADFPDA